MMVRYLEDCKTTKEKVEFLADFISYEIDKHQKRLDELNKALQRHYDGEETEELVAEMKLQLNKEDP